MNIGLIGCGRVSEYHMCAYKHIPEANVVALSEINLERGRAFAKKHNIKQTFTDYKELLGIKDLDIVDISTPTSTHAKIVCEVAKSGHNILLEKPMARTSSECDEIIREVAKHNVKLCVCHNQLFLPQVMYVKAKVDSGEFPLTYFRVLVRESAELIGAPSWIMTPEHGGALWETGAHCAYLQLHFLKDIDSVSAVGEKINHSVYDHFICLLKSQAQTIGAIEISWLAKKTEVTFDFIDTSGKQLQIPHYNSLLEYPEKRPRRLLQGFYQDQKRITQKWIKPLFKNLKYRHVLTCMPQYILFNKYIHSIKNNLESPVTPEDGRKTVRLLEYIQESLDKNQPIKVK